MGNNATKKYILTISSDIDVRFPLTIKNSFVNDVGESCAEVVGRNSANNGTVYCLNAGLDLMPVEKKIRMRAPNRYHFLCWLVLGAMLNLAIASFIYSWTHESATQMQIFKRLPKIFIWNFD